MLGYPDQASQMSDQLDADSRQLGHPFDIGWASTWGAAYVLDYRREPDRKALSRQGNIEAGLCLLDECLGQIERPGWHERVWLAEILRLKGWVLMRQGRRTEAEAQLRASIES